MGEGGLNFLGTGEEPAAMLHALPSADPAFAWALAVIPAKAGIHEH